MGRDSRSIQFFDFDGDATFKIFVRRDENQDLVGEQVAMFDAQKRALKGS